MMETGMSLKMKMIELMEDAKSAQRRWIFVLVLASVLFGASLIIYVSPAAEYGTRHPTTYTVDFKDYKVQQIDVAAIPYTYFMYFEAEMPQDMNTQNNWVYAYVFTGKDPGYLFTSDAAAGDLDKFLITLEAESEQFKRLTFGDNSVDWELALRDCDTTTFYVVFYNPQNVDNTYYEMESNVKLTTYYEPMLPLVPLTLLLLALLSPIAIVRIYILQQRKKELRVQLSLDVDNLSDEDKVKLGIPVERKPSPPAPREQPQAAVGQPPPQYAEGPPQQVTARPPPPTPAAPPSPPPEKAPPTQDRGGPKGTDYMTPDEL